MTEFTLSDSTAWETPTYPDLPGKVAVVTGGSRGIGKATCRALAANGAWIAVNGRDEAAIGDTVDTIRAAGGVAVPAPADCTSSSAVEAMRRYIETELGPVDVLIANAGGGRQPQPVTQITEDDWRTDIDRNLTATFLTMQAFLPGMIERRRGSIITMASAAARQPGGAPIAYAAAKAGVVTFSQQVAHEVGQHGVRVNCVSPSTVVNETMQQHIPEDRRAELANLYPLGRLGEPDDIASAMLFLASETSSWITGITLDIAGGHIMR